LKLLQKTAANVEAAFINTATKIHQKIQKGIFDVTNETYGIKLGPSPNSAQQQTPGAPSEQQKDGCGC